MADEPSNTGAGGPPEPPLSFNMQYVKDLSFENPTAPHGYGDMNPPPEISIEINVGAQNLQERVFEVSLSLKAQAKREETAFFIVELTYAGVATVAEFVPNEEIRPLVLIEGPRLLFPFAREILSNAVRDGGFPPLLLNPLDFARLYRFQQTTTAAGTA